MSRNLKFFRSFALVAALFTLTSCDRSDSPSDSPLAPPSADLLGLFQQNYSFTLINESVLPPLDLRASELIGLAGGSVTLMGHTLTVPAGAVSVPTLFTLVALPTPNIDVDASASVTGLLGQVLDVGSFGFKKPVTLTLTYSRATNVTNPNKLFIVYFGANGAERLASTVNSTAKTVSTKLNHFSKYGMATD